MEHGSSLDAALSVSLALAAGMVAQSVARHLRVPGIVLLLAVGFALGPDLLGVIYPQTLGSALQVLVGFAVAIILFEGGLNLSLKRLQTQAGVIQRLITLGALTTAIGGALLARFVMRWDWPLAVLFGSLVVVTGPTVITPLLRRIKLTHKIETVLEAEGVLIDAVGAVLAIVTLEVVLSFSARSVAEGALELVSRLGLGLAFGYLGGFFIALLLRHKKLVPDGFENVLTLSLVLALYQVSNALLSESGIVAVTAAGVAVGNIRTRALRDLMEFKEQLTLMFIGLLFVLLVADVRVKDVLDLGWAGLFTVAGLMLLVRPLNGWLCTVGSDLSWRERTFIAWLAPRGVVAAAVASLFAQTLDTAGIPGGRELRAAVFLVIAVTVNVQGSTAGLVAGLMGLRRSTHRGFAILGANELGRTLGRLLGEAGTEVVFIDNNPTNVRAAERDGCEVIHGNAVEESTLERAELDERGGSIAVTANDEMNLMFAATAAADYRLKENCVALRDTQTAIGIKTVEERGGQLLFGKPRDLELWMVRIRRGLVVIESWKIATKLDEDELTGPFDFAEQLALPMLLRRGNKIYPVSSARPPREGDVVEFALFKEMSDEARAHLTERGWSPVGDQESAVEEVQLQ